MGDVVFPEFVQAFKFISFHVAVIVSIAAWISQSEERKDLIYGGVVDAFEGHFGFVSLFEIGLESSSCGLIGEFTNIAQTA